MWHNCPPILWPQKTGDLPQRAYICYCDHYAFTFLTPSWTYETYFHFHSLSFFSSFSWGYFFKLWELRSHSTPTLNFKNSYYFLSFQSSNLPFKLKTLILCSFFIHKAYSHTDSPFSGSGLKYMFSGRRWLTRANLGDFSFRRNV